MVPKQHKSVSIVIYISAGIFTGNICIKEEVEEESIRKPDRGILNRTDSVWFWSTGN